MGDRLPPPGEPSLRSTPSANTAATDPARAYFPALDGLRALAVLGVLAFHEGWALGGFLGVDLFFVLSGFLITRLLLLELAQSGRVSVLGFWQRRIARLFPALITVTPIVANSALVSASAPAEHASPNATPVNAWDADRIAAPPPANCARSMT